MKSQFPLVSVLIAAYNVEKYIEDSIRSVMNQTYKNLQIIIVNDGSTDNTNQIIERLMIEDSRILKVNNESNIGFIGSLNVGLNYVNGEYIARTDADDIAKPDWIEKITSAMFKNPNIIAMGSHLEIISISGELNKYNKTGDIWKHSLEHENIIRDMLFYNPMHNNTMIMKSEVYKKHHLTFDYNYKYAEDYKFWFEVSKLGELANFPEALVYYRLHENQTSSYYNKEQRLMANRIRKEVINDYLNKLGFDIIIKEHIAFSDLESILDKVYSLKLSECNMNILKSILYEFYLSIEVYNLKDLYVFFRNKRYNFFSKKENIKIVKRFLRPNKYQKVI